MLVANTRGLGMNRFLASGLSSLNGLLAFLLILFGLVVGGTISGVLLESSGGFAVAIVGAVLGAVAGGVLAILICGFLAILIDMKDTLHRIEEQQGSLRAMPAHNTEALPNNNPTE